MQFDELFQKANEEQRHIIQIVLDAIKSTPYNNNLFLLDAPAGCGKTFNQTALLAKLRSQHKIVIPAAYTGIAASLLEGGRTLHNIFKLPIPLLDNSVADIKPNSIYGKYLDKADLIIIDEASMIPVHALTVINNLFKD